MSHESLLEMLSRMAALSSSGASASSHQTPRSHIEDLIPEILMIIFDFVISQNRSKYVTNNYALFPSLAVCRRFNDIGTPLAYRKWVLSEKCIGLNSRGLESPSRDRFLGKVETYCEFLTIYRTPIPPFVDFGRAAKLISNAFHLRAIEWISPRGMDMPVVILSAIRGKNSPPQMHFKEYFHVSEKNRKSIPVDLFISIHIPRVRNPRLASGPSNRLLVDAQNVTKLSLGEVAFDPNLGRLPPYKSLEMSGFSSMFNEDNFDQVWDFSQLRSLSLQHTNLARFLSLAPMKEMYKLENFRIDSRYCKDDPFGCSDKISVQKDITAKLNSLLSRFYQIRHLEIVCHVKDIRLSLLTRGQSLRFLKITDFSEYEQKGLPDPTRETEDGTPNNTTGIHDGISFSTGYPALHLNDLSLLSQNSPFITELDLYIDAEDPSLLRPLTTISKLLYLRKLSLRIQSASNPKELDTTIRREDRTDIYRLFAIKALLCLQLQSPLTTRLRDLRLHILRRKYARDPDGKYTLFDAFPCTVEAAYRGLGNVQMIERSSPARCELKYSWRFSEFSDSFASVVWQPPGNSDQYVVF